MSSSPMTAAGSASRCCEETAAWGVVNPRAWRRRATPPGGALRRPKEWERLLRAPGDDAIVARPAQTTRTGRPLASDSSLSKLDTRLGRHLRALPRVRPRKEPTARKNAPKGTGKRKRRRR